MADRRRFNPPAGGTSAPVFEPTVTTHLTPRLRSAKVPRKIFLQTGIVPSASGSAYLEQTPTDHSSSNPRSTPKSQAFTDPTSALKLICTVHGPRPLPRNTPFSSTLVLTTHVKYAPFASSQRKGFVRDPAERDLGAHLETALRGVIIGERWPKAGVEVVVTVLEGESDCTFADTRDRTGAGIRGLGAMNVLAGAITAASAALVDAGIDCVDLVAGGVAALATVASTASGTAGEGLVDPCTTDLGELDAACVVGYLQARDEVTEVWTTGRVGAAYESLIDTAVEAAVMNRGVLAEAIRESTKAKIEQRAREGAAASGDTDMNG